MYVRRSGASSRSLFSVCYVPNATDDTYSGVFFVVQYRWIPAIMAVLCIGGMSIVRSDRYRQ